MQILGHIKNIYLREMDIVRGNMGEQSGGGFTTLSLGLTSKNVDKDGRIDIDSIDDILLHNHAKYMPDLWVQSIGNSILNGYCNNTGGNYYIPYISYRNTANGAFVLGANVNTIEIVYFDNDKISNSNNSPNYDITLLNTDGNTILNRLICPSIDNAVLVEKTGPHYTMKVNGHYDNLWIRTPINGLIPFAELNKANSHLGYEGWPFRGVWAVNYYKNNTQMATLSLANSSNYDTEAWSY